jgi:hypothetical protein
MNYHDIYQLITSEQANYKFPIPFADTGMWSMYDHINLTVKYKNSIYRDGYDENKPFKNIIRPLLNLQYRAEGFDVKDIIIYIEDAYKYFKSFLVRKYHERWARENDIDTFIDKIVESYVDFGGALIKDTGGARPEVVPLQRIAFCDQTDILSGPIAERHFFAPDQLAEMESRGWKNIERVTALAKQEADTKGVDYGKKAKTPGKYIEVYEVHGMFPRHWLYDKDDAGNYDGEYFEGTEETQDNEYVRQVHICTFYQAPDGMSKGVSLYKGTEKELPYKLLLRDEIFGRGLGLGGAEELFEPQVWVNYDEIHKKNMLDAASKVILQTTDAAFANRNKLQNMQNLEVAVTEVNTRIEQIPTTPVNLPLFENSTKAWEEHARQMAGANESILGESPTAGTPFKLQELVTAESHSLHEYRKGKIATFLDEVYRDWIIPKLAREIMKGKTFLAELELDELQTIAEQLVVCETNKMIKEKILNGETLDPAQVDAFKQDARERFVKGGNKKFVEILKDELKDAPMSVEINIAGKQKYLAGMTDKLVNVFRTIVANPSVLQNPAMAKLFNQIIESSGLEPLDFTGFTVAQPAQLTPPQQVPAGGTQPLQELNKPPQLAQQVA